MVKRTVYTPEAFELEVKKFAEATGVKLADVLTKTGIQIHDELSAGTPRDTGRASAAWNFTVDRVDPDVPPPGRYPPGAAKRGQSGELGKAKDTSTVYITNNLPYILPLAHGHSKQAPSGWVERVLFRFEAYMKGAIRTARPRL